RREDALDATMSSSSLNPWVDSLGAMASSSDRRIMKKPLIGSLRRTPRVRLATSVASRLLRRLERERPPSAPPPSANRLPIARSAPSRMSSSMRGSKVSLCCRSASIMAMAEAEDASKPSIQAPASPRRPMRLMQRTRAFDAAMSRTTAAVPSGLLSSTKITSQRMPFSAWVRRATTRGTFGASLKVGITTVSSGAVGSSAVREPVRGQSAMDATHHPPSDAGAGALKHLLPSDHAISKPPNPAFGAESLGQSRGVIASMCPFGKGHGLAPVVLDIVLTEQVEDACRGPAKVAVAHGQLPAGNGHRHALFDMEIDHAHQAGAIGA